MPSPEERICRALCSADGNPENIAFEGKPMWQSYRDAARAALGAVQLEPLLDIVREVAGGTPASGLQQRARQVLADYEAGCARRRRRR
jgi:hypothetical protein